MVGLFGWLGFFLKKNNWFFPNSGNLNSIKRLMVLSGNTFYITLAGDVLSPPVRMEAVMDFKERRHLSVTNILEGFGKQLNLD